MNKTSVVVTRGRTSIESHGIRYYSTYVPTVPERSDDLHGNPLRKGLGHRDKRGRQFPLGQYSRWDSGVPYLSCSPNIVRTTSDPQKRYRSKRVLEGDPVSGTSPRKHSKISVLTEQFSSYNITLLIRPFETPVWCTWTDEWWIGFRSTIWRERS